MGVSLKMVCYYPDPFAEGSPRRRTATGFTSRYFSELASSRFCETVQGRLSIATRAGVRSKKPRVPASFEMSWKTSPDDPKIRTALCRTGTLLGVASCTGNSSMASDFRNSR